MSLAKAKLIEGEGQQQARSKRPPLTLGQFGYANSASSLSP
jgi:hypothetical protein